jgi:hypothetical protein
MFLRGRTSETYFIGPALRPRGDEAREALAAMLQEQDGAARLRRALAGELPPGKSDTMTGDELVGLLADGVARQRYVLIGWKPQPVWAPALAPADGPAGEEQSPPEEAKEDEDQWLEIVLQDDGNPPRPVPGARYVVELPDGTLIEGTLDKNGKARLEGIKGATAKVSFPDVDAPEWK